MGDDRRGEKHPIWWFLYSKGEHFLEDFIPAIILFPLVVTRVQRFTLSLHPSATREGCLKFRPWLK